MSTFWRDALPVEKADPDALLNRPVQIYWDGDDAYYAGRVHSYDTATGKHKVVYVGDDTVPAEEDLVGAESRWQIWTGSEDDFHKYRDKSFKRQQKAAAVRPKTTYLEKTLVALYTLASDRGGSTLQAIRKTIERIYADEVAVNKASFNNLTKKAILQSVVVKKVERIGKQHYKLMPAERQRRMQIEHGITHEPAGARGKGKPGRYDSATTENNRRQRISMIDLKNRRDVYLKQRYDLIEPFLPDTQNYFKRKERKDILLDLFAYTDIDMSQASPDMPMSERNRMAEERAAFETEYAAYVAREKEREKVLAAEAKERAAAAAAAAAAAPALASAPLTHPTPQSMPVAGDVRPPALGTTPASGPAPVAALQTLAPVLAPAPTTAAPAAALDMVSGTPVAVAPVAPVAPTAVAPSVPMGTASVAAAAAAAPTSVSTQLPGSTRPQPSDGLRSKGPAPPMGPTSEELRLKAQREHAESLRERSVPPPKFKQVRVPGPEKFKSEDGRCYEIRSADMLAQLNVLGMYSKGKSTATPSQQADAHTMTGAPFVECAIDCVERFPDDPAPVLASEDAQSIDMVITEKSPFQGFTVLFPGRRLKRGQSYKTVCDNPAGMDWRNVYWLAKQDALPSRAVPSSSSPRSSSSDEAAMDVDAADGADAEDGVEDEDEGETYDEKGSEVPVAPIIYTTALRLSDGRFIAHPSRLFKNTIAYAKRAVTPISNRVHITFTCPHTQEQRQVIRQFCDARHYVDMFKRSASEKLKESSHMFDRFCALDEKQKARLEREKAELKLYLSGPKPEPEVVEGEDSAAAESEEGAMDVAAAMDDDDAPEESVLVDPDLLKAREAVNSASADISQVKLLAKPPQMTAVLHDHQIEGISWMVHMYRNGVSMILGDQMGLGKTIQSIGFIANLRYVLEKPGPYLIVVPLSVLSNWMSEIERFCPALRAVRFHGPRAERDRIKDDELRSLKEFDVVVTTYEMLVSEANFFRRRFIWTTVIVDEGHRLKNEKSQLSEKLKQINALNKVILTGTPLQNNLRELWALLHFLQPEIFVPGSAEFFENGFDLVRGKIDNNLLRKARHLLTIFMLRRLKEHVNIPLPSRREVTMLVPLTEQQNEFYRQLLYGMGRETIEVVMRVSQTGAAALPGSGDSSTALATVGASASTSSGGTGSKKSGGDNEYRKLMNLLLQLRKVCNHVDLIKDAYDIEQDSDSEEEVGPDGQPTDPVRSLVEGSGKLQMLDRMLPRLKADDHRVLIFSQFTSMLDILEDYCEGRQYSYVRLDGNTNRVQRRLDCRRYNEDGSKIFIFLISTRAGGLGLNLATADTVILYDSDWNPQVDLQAMERAHRIGQVKPVRVYRLVCRGSVEERMVSRAEKKLFLNAMVAERSEDDNLVDGKEDESTALGIGGGTMSKGELASLIRFGANAIMDSNKGLDDVELDDLLEREGRDIHLIRAVEEASAAAEAAAAASDETVPAGASSSTTATASFGATVASSSSAAARAAAAAPKDSIKQMQKTLKDRLELLEEVDLRQLGDKMYNKKRVSLKEKEIIASASITDVLPDGATRERKQRIVMVDGSGSGYGNMVPVLQDNMSDSEPEEEEAEEPKKANRGRAWSQMCYCTLCGLGQAKRQSEAANTLCNCAHCPRTFHLKCLHSAGIVKGNTIFICPHHKCGACARSTAAAGGLLFRCVCCMTAFCEDCLPQDEVESLGRCRDFEEQCGYYSKQAYYVKCQSCLGEAEDDGENDEGEPQVQELDGEGLPVAVKEDMSGGNGSSKNVSQAQDPVLPTQLMLVHWEHLVDEKDLDEEARLAALAAAEEARRLKEEAAARKAEEDAAWKAAKEAAAAAKKKKGASRKRKKAPTAATAAPKSKKKAVAKAAPAPKPKPVVEVWPVKVPAGVLSFDTALNVVLKHADTDALLQSGPTGKKGSLDPAQAISLIRTKIDAGRYRSSTQFASDVSAALASSKPMLAFFERKVQLSLD